MRILVIGLALTASVGCGSLDRVLAVDPLDRVPALPLESSPANAPVLANGAIADFDCAFGAYVVMGGLIGEELEESRSIIDRKPYDQRTHSSRDRLYAVSPCDQIGVYTPLQTARVSAVRAIRLLDGWRDDEVVLPRDSLLATMHAYAGYATLLLGEGFCSTVLSAFDASGALVYGGEVTRDSAFRAAESHFGAAIARAARAKSVLDLALAGRARARLDRGDLVGARADAVRVPPEFAHLMTASASPERRENRVRAQERPPLDLVTVGLLYRSLGDPRVPVTDQRRVGPTRVPVFYEEKYPSAASPIRIASGAEARLIVAEADIAAASAASLANARTIIDAFRARGNQPPLAASDAATLRAALIDQRRRELFLEGQHLGDVIRYGIVLTPPVGAPYPGGGTYGAQRCLPLPDVERDNNPALRD